MCIRDRISIGQKVDETNRSLEVYASIKEENVQFRPGMYLSLIHICLEFPTDSTCRLALYDRQSEEMERRTIETRNDRQRIPSVSYTHLVR